MRVFIILVFIITFSFSLTAQPVDRTNFRAGLHGGVVTGDFSEAYSFVLGVDVLHHWGVSKTLDLGIATGFSNAFGETQEFSDALVSFETKFENWQTIPVAGSIRIYPAKGFKLGGDVGYAVGLNSGNEGGFYYRPSIGFDLKGGTTEFNVSYYSVNGDSATYASVLAGFLILF